MHSMLIMMKSFFKSLRKYHRTLKRQDDWIQKFVHEKHYQVNTNLMFNTNLKLWLSEAEDTFGKRICPCFSPTGDKQKDRAMLCPCKYLEEDIKSKGTCHCTLFASSEATKSTFITAMARLMKEYQTPLYYNDDGEIDIRRYPIDSIRNLRVPDAYHILKRAVIMADLPLRMFVEFPFEVEALQIWAEKNGYQTDSEPRANGYVVTVN